MGHERQVQGPGRGTAAGVDADERAPSADTPGKQTLADSVTVAPDAAIRALIARARARGGAGLAGELRAALEEALGTSLGDVTMHTSNDADIAARALDADAFAIGSDVFFAAGRHDPATPNGRALIAHEVAHAVQQRGARDDGPLSVSSPADSHEVEAERFAESFAARSSGLMSNPISGPMPGMPPPPMMPISPVRTSVARRTIARQPTGTTDALPPSPSGAPSATPAAARREPVEAFSIQPARTLATIGPAAYQVPAAQDPSRRDGRYLCTWTIEPDPSVNAPHQRRVYTGSWNDPMSMIPVRWLVEGHHKVICDLRWHRSPAALPGRLETPPPPPRRLELAVEVRTLANVSRGRFDDVARTDAYFDARLRDMVPEARAAAGETVVEDPRALRERRERLQAQQAASDKIEPGRQVICRAQLTTRASMETVALALAIGPATGQPGRVVLVDFTPNQRRMDYSPASSTAEAIEALKNRNSYRAGLVEIDVPEDRAAGVAPLHTTFETTGESSMGAWASNLGAIGLAGVALGGIASVVFAPIAAPLLLVGAVAGGVASGVSLAERLHDARPSGTGITIDALGVVASVLGLGGAFAGMRTVTVMGRTMRVVDATGRLALAADGASLVLVAAESVDEIARIWGDRSKSETDRLQAIALVLARLTANVGIVVVANAATLRPGHGQPPGSPPASTTAPVHAPASAAAPVEPPRTPTVHEPSPRPPAPREPGADPSPGAPTTRSPGSEPPAREPAPPTGHEPTSRDQSPGSEPARAPSAGDPNAGAVPASVVRAAQTPQEVLRAMQEEKSRVRRVAGNDGPGWREHVTEETAFVRVIDRGELERVVGEGRVMARRVETLMRDPVAGHAELLERLWMRDADGRLRLREDLGATEGGRRDPQFPISAIGPAETGGYIASLTRETGQGFLVKFRQTVRRAASPNNDLRESEYFIPLWYRLEEIEWIADVRQNRFLYGAPGRAGTPEEAAALRRTMGLDGPGAPTARDRLQVPPEVRHEAEVLALARRLLDRARATGDRTLTESVNDLHSRIHHALANVRSGRESARVRGADFDAAAAAQELAAFESELAALIDRVAARVGPRPR